VRGYDAVAVLADGSRQLFTRARLPKGVEPGDFRYRNAGCELSRRTSGILVNDL